MEGATNDLSQHKYIKFCLRGGGGLESTARIPTFVWHAAGGSGKPPSIQEYRQWRANGCGGVYMKTKARTRQTSAKKNDMGFCNFVLGFGSFGKKRAKGNAEEQKDRDDLSETDREPKADMEKKAPADTKMEEAQKQAEAGEQAEDGDNEAEGSTEGKAEGKKEDEAEGDTEHKTGGKAEDKAEDGKEAEGEEDTTGGDDAAKAKDAGGGG